MPPASRGRNEWAALPAKSALALVPSSLARHPGGGAQSLEREPRHQERTPRRAERRGQHVVRQLVPRSDEGLMQPHPAVAPVPSPAAVASSERSRMAAEPSSSGCARGEEDGPTRGRTARSGSVRKNGEVSASGWTAEQTSWVKPGRVSSADRRPPPIVASRLAQDRAQARPREGDRGREAVGTRSDDDGVGNTSSSGGGQEAFRLPLSRSTNPTTKSSVSAGASKERKWPASATVRSSRTADAPSRFRSLVGPGPVVIAID